MKKNQGFSLIELVVALAILSIVGLILVSFVSISSKTFRSVNSEVDLQYESQITVNQLKNLIIDSNRGIAYGLQPIVGDFTLVNIEDSHSESTLLTNLESADASNIGKVKRCLLIYNEQYQQVSSSYVYSVIKIVWDPVTQELSYGSKDFTNLTDLESDQYLNSLTSSEYYLMSEYTERFSVFMENTEEKTITLQLELENNGKDYSTTPSISLRNKVVVSNDIHSIYEEKSIERLSLINGVNIKKAGNIVTNDTVSVGTSVQYVADVDTQFGASTGSESVQWILSGNSTYGTGEATKILQTGELVVSPYELSTQLTLTAVSVVDSSKKAVVILTVENGRGEFGYVNFLTLGSVMTGDIIAPTSPGGPYMYYGVTFENTSSYISYINEAKLTAAEKGVTWKVVTDAPSGSYTFGVFPSGTSAYGLPTSCPVYIKAYYEAMGYTFNIYATTNGENYAGDKIVASKSFQVSGMQQPIVEITPTIELDVNSLTLARNGRVAVTKNIQNVENMAYTLEIDTASGTGFNESVTNKKGDNVYLNSDQSFLFAKTQMDWNTEFSFKVKLRVTGYTNKGTAVDKTIVRTVTVPKVVATVSPTSTSVAFARAIKLTPTSINYTNLNVGSSGVIDNNYYPAITITGPIYYYYNYNSRRWNSFNVGSSDVTYLSNPTGSISLSKAFMENLYYNYRYYTSNELEFNLNMAGTNNTLTQAMTYTFY